MIPLTPFRRHVERWRDCGLCDLARTRNRIVLARGKVPCDVLFVGEAPGDSEDVLGLPFVGPAGFLLDRIIADALPAAVSFALTNLVACIPIDPATGEKEKGGPDAHDVMACQPRLQEFIDLCKPKLCVAVGAQARNWLEPGYKKAVKLPCPHVAIDHPAFIIRSNAAAQGLLIQKAAVTVANALEECLVELTEAYNSKKGASRDDSRRSTVESADDDIPF